MDMDRLAIENRTTRERATIQDTAFAQGRCRRNQSKVSDVASDLTVYTPHYRVGCVTESRSSLGNRIEYRLKLGRRARDRLLLCGDCLFQYRDRLTGRRDTPLRGGFLRGLFIHLKKPD